MLWIVMELMEGSLRDVLKWKYHHGLDVRSIALFSPLSRFALLIWLN